MPTGIYERTDYHRKILSKNSAFKKGVSFRKGLPSPFKGKRHTRKAKLEIGRKAIRMWRNPEIRKTISRGVRHSLLGKFGPAHQSFKGRILNSNGYWYIYNPNHPMATKTKYVLEHRLNVEKHLGRFLTKSESVHHINEKRQDNRLNNLMVFINRGAHKSFHACKTVKPADIVFDGRSLK